MRPGDLVLWRIHDGTQRGEHNVCLIIDMCPIRDYGGAIAHLLAYNGKVYKVPLNSHYVLEVINETR